MMSQTTEVNNSHKLIRDFIDAADVSDYFLYRKDGYILTYLRVYPFNLNLLTTPEKKAITTNLSASFKDDRNNFIYSTLPRELDLDKYKSLIKKKYQEEINIGKKRILADMLLEGTILSTSGENYEHQHFIKIWKKGKDKRAVEADLLERIKDFRDIFASVGIYSEILQEQEITKLCNLFGNSLQASYESTDKNSIYTQMMQL